MLMDMVGSLERVLGEARALIGSISTADLAAQTPCSEWTVSALVEHMTGVVTNFGRAFGGDSLTPPAAPGDGGPTAESLSATYGQAVDTLLAAVKTPGALDKTLKLPFGEMPGQRAVGIAMADQMIHTWDLSKALGKPYSMDETLATMVLRGMHELMAANPGARGEGRAFGPEVACADDAPAQDRLVAFTGRRP
jgi:uncharacterized protein (TIGR03086 family)